MFDWTLFLTKFYRQLSLPILYKLSKCNRQFTNQMYKRTVTLKIFFKNFKSQIKTKQSFTHTQKNLLMIVKP